MDRRDRCPRRRGPGRWLTLLAAIILAAGCASPAPTASPTPTAGDAAGFVQLEYQALPVNGRAPDAAAMATIRAIVESRVNATGVVEPVVQVQGTDRIVVMLPGVTDPDQIRTLLGQTGRLEFVSLPPERYGTGSDPGPNSAVPGQALPTQETTLFSNDQVDRMFPTTDSTGTRTVGFHLKSQGAEQFGDYTSKNVGNFFAIILDGKVISAPVIQGAITGGDGIITGGSDGFTATEMNNLITILQFGSLPFPLVEVGSQQTASPPGATPTP